MTPVDVIIRTYNSGMHLRECLRSARANLSINKILVIDHRSSDSTVQIAQEFSCLVFQEDAGLGYATALGAEKAETDFILYMDSDVVLKSPSFQKEAEEMLEEERTGAVVGQAMGHIFNYGIPLSLTMFRRSDFLSINIKPSAMGRETYFIQKAFRDKNYRIQYVSNAMKHNSSHRNNKYWPEWQGAWVRDTAGFSIRELLYSFLVIFLMLTNSRNFRNFLYIPVFQAKLTRGFLKPEGWLYRRIS